MHSRLLNDSVMFITQWKLQHGNDNDAAADDDDDDSEGDALLFFRSAYITCAIAL